MSKQDRQGVRTPADLERKYNLGQLIDVQGLTAKQETALNQLVQTLNQYVATTNAKLKELEKGFSDNIDESLKINEDGSLGVNMANSVEEGNELPVTSDAVARDIAKRIADAIPDDILSEEKLTEVIKSALSEAKESGEFKGDPGEKGDKGDSYTLTSADKTEIAKAAADEIDKSGFVTDDEIADVIKSGNLGGKILWQGELFMKESQVANLSEPVSKQPNGIVLVFSYYNNEAAQNAAFQHFFVSKKFVELSGSSNGGNGVGNNFFLHTNGFLYVGTKYLYISDTAVTGYSGNDDAVTEFTASGIAYSNNKFVLRFVIGV